MKEQGLPDQQNGDLRMENSTDDNSTPVENGNGETAPPNGQISEQTDKKSVGDSGRDGRKMSVKDGHLKNSSNHGSGCQSAGRKIRGQSSLDSAISNMSDNVFSCAVSSSGSSSDLTSVSSISIGPLSARETATSKKRFELSHNQHQHQNDATPYITPLQRKEKEVKELKRQIALLVRDGEEKDAELFSLRCWVQGDKKQYDGEKDREIAELSRKLRVSESEKTETQQELCKAREELKKIDENCTEMKRHLTEKEEQFEECYLEMYKKGHQAATFEREEELEMLASNRKSRVTVKELTRKLSRTEQELAKWQHIRLEESYSQAETPETQAEATLSFLKDAFFHFLSDTSQNEDHLRAILKILRYSEVQANKIKKGLAEFKNLDRKKIFKDKDLGGGKGRLGSVGDKREGK